jgi:hypothetical protein
MVDKVALGPGFLRVLRFPLPILISPTAPHSSSSIVRSWYNRSVSGRRTKWTQSQPHPKKLKKKATSTLLGYAGPRTKNRGGGGGDVGWIHLAEDSDHRRVIANTVLPCCLHLSFANGSFIRDFRLQ